MPDDEGEALLAAAVRAGRSFGGPGPEGPVFVEIGAWCGKSTVYLVAAAWRRPLAFCFIDGGHGEAPAWADYRGWAPHVAVGGWLAIHDVFPDPADGGRPPYELWCDAVASGRFVEDGEQGSLRILRRTDPDPT
jgi:hypothetical protein